MESNSNSPLKLRVECSLEAADAAWDEFVCGLKDYNLEQTSVWGSLKNRQGWQALRVKILDEGGKNIIAGAQILEKKIGKYVTVGYLCRGPLYKVDSPPVEEMLVRNIKEVGKLRKYSILIAALPYLKKKYEEVFKKFGFAVHPSSLPPSSTMFSTLVLDLSDDIDTIMKKMRSTTRKHIRQGEKRGVRVREGGSGDIDTFNAHYKELCIRRSVKPNVPYGAFIKDFYAWLSKVTEVKLFVAELDSEAISSMLVVANGEWVRAWRIGWNGSNSDCRPNEALYWAAVKWAKSKGYRWFDFGGFDRTDASGIIKGMSAELIKCQISNFKYGFGGMPIIYPAQYSYVYNPLIRTCMKVTNDKFFRSKIAQGLIRRYVNLNL